MMVVHVIGSRIYVAENGGKMSPVSREELLELLEKYAGAQ